MLKTKLRLVSIVLLMAAATLISLAAGQESCPPLLASLMPAGVVHVTGQYNSAGIVGMGFAAANIPFDHPCTRSDKYPGHITFDIKHYSGEGVELFKMQIGSEEQQRLQNAKDEFTKAHAKLDAAPKTGALGGLVSVSPLKTEKASGGTIIYYDYYTDCSEGVKRSKPSARLMGVAHNGDTAINIEAEGFISAEVAKAAASQILANFVKTDFTKLDGGK